MLRWQKNEKIGIQPNEMWRKPHPFGKTVPLRGEGDYQIELFRDGINADRAACDYKKEVLPVPANRKLTVKMAPGGGYVAKITKRVFWTDHKVDEFQFGGVSKCVRVIVGLTRNPILNYGSM